MSEADTEPRYRDPAWLREQYLERRRSKEELAARADCHPKTVGKWLREFGINRPSNREQVRAALEAAIAAGDTLPGAGGVPVRAITARVDIARSTTENHLKELALAGELVRGRGYDPRVNRPVVAWFQADGGGEPDE